MLSKGCIDSVDIMRFMLQSHSHEQNHTVLAPNLKLASLTLIRHSVVKKEKQQDGEKQTL